ncbi:hypothetical protein D3C81_554050 [compost metagenome]
MPRAVELARLAERHQLLGRAFDAALFLADQKHLTTFQARGYGVEDVIGQILGLGQKHHGRLESLFGHIHAKMAALGETGVERGLVTGMPAPAVSVRQAAEQIVGGQTGQQNRTLE